MALSQTIKKACRRYEEIETDGLVLYPVLVEEMETFELARPGIEIVQQSLPVAYAAMPLLAALYRMEYDALQSGETGIGLFPRAVLMLALSLRLGRGLPAEKRTGMFRCKVDPEDMGCLKAVEFTVDGEELHRVTPVQFQRLREIIAEQNGIRLAPPEANPELIEAQRELARMNSVPLSGDLYERISAVSALEHVEETDIDRWPVLKLQEKTRTWQRIVGYAVCAVAEAQGTTWKNGNPYPSLFYEKEDTGNTGLRPMEQATRNLGQA